MLFMGRAIEDMSRDELIQVIYQLAHAIERERAMHMDTLNAWSATQKGREWQRNFHH